MKSRLVEVELFRADGRTDEERNMTKPTDAFPNFANVPIKTQCRWTQPANTACHQTREFTW